MTLRNLAIWGVIVVVLFGLYSVLSQGRTGNTPTEMSYSQLLKAADDGVIKSATITGERVDAKDAKGKLYTATTPTNRRQLARPSRPVRRVKCVPTPTV